MIEKNKRTYILKIGTNDEKQIEAEFDKIAFDLERAGNTNKNGFRIHISRQDSRMTADEGTEKKMLED